MARPSQRGDSADFASNMRTSAEGKAPGWSRWSAHPHAAPGELEGRVDAAGRQKGRQCSQRLPCAHAPAQRGAAGAQLTCILESLAAERMFCHPVPQGDAQLPCQ